MRSAAWKVARTARTAVEIVPGTPSAGSSVGELSATIFSTLRRSIFMLLRSPWVVHGQGSPRGTALLRDDERTLGTELGLGVGEPVVLELANQAGFAERSQLEVRDALLGGLDVVVDL